MTRWCRSIPDLCQLNFYPNRRTNIIISLEFWTVKIIHAASKNVAYTIQNTWCETLLQHIWLDFCKVKSVDLPGMVLSFFENVEWEDNEFLKVDLHFIRYIYLLLYPPMFETSNKWLLPHTIYSGFPIN